MGQRKMGRDVRIGWVGDRLRVYEKDYRLIANWRRPYCEHKRDLRVSLLLRLFPSDTTIGEIAGLLLGRCGMRGARIRAEFVGAIGEGGLSTWRRPGVERAPARNCIRAGGPMARCVRRTVFIDG